VVGNKVDDGLELVFFDAPEQCFELIEALVRVGGVVRADVKVVTNRVGGAGLAFDQQWIVRGSLGVGGRACLLEYAGEPKVGDAELAQGCQGCVIDVCKFTAAIFLNAAVELGRDFRIAEVAHHELVYVRSTWMIHNQSLARMMEITRRGWYILTP